MINMFSPAKIVFINLHQSRTSISGCLKFLSISHPVKSSTTEKDLIFSGEIPIEKLQFKYSRSRGPGGQNVNKVSSKVELRFKVAEANWIPDTARERLVEKERNRVTKEGEFYLTSEKTRKQILNQADCVNRLRQMIFDASQEPKQPSPEDLKLAEKRAKRRAASILQEKRHHSLKKQTRGSLGTDF